MKNPRLRPIFTRSVCIVNLILFLACVSPRPSLSQTSKKEAVMNTKSTGQTEIKSDSLEIDFKQNMVTFTGNVDAKSDNMTINCQKMLLYYKNQSGNKAADKDDTGVDRIIATGEVKITRPDGGLATAEKAVFYGDDEKVVLTGKPVVRQGNDFVEGSTITMFLKENRSIVEGSDDHKVRAVLFPNSGKR